MSVTAKAPEAGYVFVSNEHPKLVDMYIDDVTVTHTPSPIVSTAVYFPFGLTFNSGARAGTLEQRFLFNGKELQDELDMNVYDFEWRQYDPTLARTYLGSHGASYVDLSPYSFLADNPFNILDPNGMDTIPAKMVNMKSSPTLMKSVPGRQSAMIMFLVTKTGRS